MANNPAILLCDEPTANLDLKTGAEILPSCGSSTSERGVTVICATHDHRVLDQCDRMMWIRDGRVERVARRHDVLVQTGTIEGEENA